VSSNLTKDKHVSNVCSTGFYWLQQQRRVRRSLATLVHAFVTSCIDYCNALLAVTLKATTDKLQRLLNAAARLVNGTRKFNRGLSQLHMHVNLHWLDVSELVTYKLVSMVHNCLHGKASRHLKDQCIRVRTLPLDVPPVVIATGCAATQSQHVWSSGLFCCGSNCLELAERRTARSDAQHRQF